MRNLIASILVLIPVYTLFPGDVCSQTATDQEFITTTGYSDEFLNALPPVELPLVVTAGFYLRNINYIDDETETFEFTGVLTLSWQDPRQAFDPGTEGIAEKLYMGDYQFNEVFTGWWPQTILINEAGMYDKHGVLLRVRPDGTLTLIETVNARAKTNLNLRQYPFDSQRLEAMFETLGFDSNEVVLQAVPDPGSTILNPDKVKRISQWHLAGISTATEDRKTSVADHEITTSAFVVRMDLQRKSLFTLRLVVIPLMIMVMLSWSVFWMDKSSVGDRFSISFIGLLTVVAYQMMLGENLPRISYVNLIYAFLTISFFIMCTTVIINLRVSFLDRQGKFAEGDLLDRRCRWIFPLVYFGLILAAAFTAFFLLPAV